MSLLFTTTFDGHPLHVLHIRGRVALLATEVGVAAGYLVDGERFTDLLCRAWAPSFDEDEDVAQLVGCELAAVKRDVGLPSDTTMALVLFPTGVERALRRSDARHARSLLGFLHRDVYSRVVTLGAADARDHDRDEAAPPAHPTVPTPAPAPSRAGMARASLVVTIRDDRATFAHRKAASEAVRSLADRLLDVGEIDEGEWADLHVEAVEVLLGRYLRTILPTFGSGSHDDNARPDAA